MKNNVLLYIFSTDIQDFESQKIAIQEYVKKNNIIIHDTIEEYGVSGYKTALKDREGLQKLMTMAMNEELETLIVFNSDRIGRRTELISFMSVMEEYKVKVISVTEGLLNNNNDDASELMQFIKFWTAKKESQKTSLRTKNGKKAKVEKTGFCGGSPNFGYKLDDKNNFVIDEDESRIVKFLFDSYIKYGTTKTIELLEKNKMYGRYKNWNQRKISNIRTNPIYIGKKQYKGELLDFPQFRIISDEVFQKAQDRAKARNTRGETRYTNRTNILFEGLLYHKCDDGVERKLHIDYVNNSSGKTHTYRCKHCGKNKSSMLKNYNSKRIEPILINEIKSQMKNLSIEGLENAYNEEIGKNKSIIEKDINIVENNINKKQKAINNAEREIEKILCGDSEGSIDIFTKIIDRCQSEIEELNQILQEHKKDLDALKNSTSKAVLLLNKYKNFEYVFDNVDNKEKKLILQELIYKIVIDKDKISIQWNLY
ncbi:MAG: recombinase family protein [Intestinibacter sp.]|uniref:recombinase family protein n=1 Tax=Intestinibacter sp. TaxID=1965304 RepID=UPI002A83BDAB|nr:recombinase family protein [Intestinibacter sp.]MDY4575064.1 recombinase family protein [Intestinibacter sp.]